MFYLFNSEYFANQFTGPLRLSPRNIVTRLMGHTACSRSSYPFYIVTYYVKWITTSCTYSTITPRGPKHFAFYHLTLY